ncbi:MAG: glycosyltransferase [Thermoplasmatales archaeon]|nr:glycosyltransferase [Thermoplasmatales archaeon]
MLAMVWVVVLLFASALAILYQGIAIVFAYQMPTLDPLDPRGPGARPPLPRISVVIAARNEFDDLPATLDSLLAQDLPVDEIVVVDGASTDGTSEVARARAPKVRLIEEPPLPAGWVGKSWACAVGARATQGEWILFLDADVRLHPAAVRTALAWATRESADLASLATRIEVGSTWERIVMPFYVQMVLTYLRAPRVNRDTSSAAMANGQFTLVRRAAYEVVGGHEAIRTQLVEDVALAQQFRAHGLRLRVAWAPELAQTRMYRSRSEISEGILKTVHGTRYSTAVQIGRIVGLVGLFWLPLGVLPLGIVTADPILIGTGAFLYVALFGKHIAFARAVRAPAAYGLLYPVAVAFFVVLLARSIRRGAGDRPVEWKGREYSLRG